MKNRGAQIALIIIATAALLLIYSFAQAQEKPDCKNSIEAFTKLNAHFVSLPDLPPVTAEGYGEICYEPDKKSAIIKGESIPTLKYVAIDPPADLKDLTVIVEGIPGTKALLSWEKFPTIVLSNLDLRVRAFNATAEHKPRADSVTKPLVDIILSDLSFTTDAIEVEGVTSEGYIDAKNLEAMLVGSTILPEHDYPPYDEWLAGQKVLLELAVKVKNPYKK